MANTLAIFQNMINQILRDLIDNRGIVYIDDILIYSDKIEEHQHVVMEMLRCLDQWNLATSINKCEFHNQQVEFLRNIISKYGIAISEEKVQTIREWQSPATPKDVQLFLSFANFYQRCIYNFSKVTKLLTDLTKEKFRCKKFNWSAEVEKSFIKLKTSFTTTPILCHFDSLLPIIVKTDISNFVISAILS
jgi:hypothetical protein